MSKTDYLELSRRSMRKDFARANFKRNGRVPRVPHPKNTKRVLELNETCQYWKYRRFFIGRLVRIIEPGLLGGVWVEFVRDGDRENLNNMAGWNGDKKRYLLQGAKFDD